MAEVNQYAIDHKELIELLIKNSDVHEGEWTLLLGLAVGTGQFGPTPQQSNPGIMVTINQIGIQRVLPGTPKNAGSIVVDAAKINPSKKKGRN